MPWQQAIREAGGVLLQREVPESVNLRVAEVARAAGVPARPLAVACLCSKPAALIRCRRNAS